MEFLGIVLLLFYRYIAYVVVQLLPGYFVCINYMDIFCVKWDESRLAISYL